MNLTLSNDQSSIIFYHNLEKISQYLYMIIYPMIFLVGLIGNLLSILLFSLTELNQNSCGIFFLLLALSSLLALIGGLHHCLTIGYHTRIPNAFYCRFRNFLLYTSMDVASWMVVALSVDRLYRIKYPFHVRVYCTRKLTIIVSAIIVGILILKNAHLFTFFIGDFTEGASDNCDPNPNYPTYMFFFETIWPWIDLTTFALCPCLIVLISNGFILYNRHQRRLKFGHRNLDRSLMKFLLINSILFLVCNFPVAVILVIYPYVSKANRTNDHYDRMDFLFDFLRLLSYTTLALNFYLYYYSSSIFRHQTTQLFHRWISKLCPSKNIPADINPVDQSPVHRRSNSAATCIDD